jgi:hypothetical protein
MKMAKQAPIKESSDYQNLIGEKETSNKPMSLLDHMDLDEEELEKLNVGEDKEWKKYWKGMPEFDQEENPTYKTLYVHFRNEEDYKEFAKMINQNLTDKTKSIWHPALDRIQNALMRWIEEE